MPAPVPIVTAVRAFFHALATADLTRLQQAALQHPDLARLLPARPKANDANTLAAELDRLQVRCEELGGGRHFVQAVAGGSIQLLVVADGPGGPRVDARYPLSALAPDDERRAVARRFYLALLLRDDETLRDLAFDARGLEVLAGPQPPAGEHGQLEHIAEVMGLVQLQPGEPFVVPGGVEFVGARHAELGIEVWSGLTPSGEVPFLLRQRDGAWKVIAFHFVQAAVLAQGGRIVPAGGGR